MSNLLHCDIGEVVQYLKEQNKIFYAIRLSDCLKDSNESLVKLTIENQKLRDERDEARILACKGLALEARHTMDKIGSNIWKKTALTPQEMAEERGWNCFKEKTDYLQDLG